MGILGTTWSGIGGGGSGYKWLFDDDLKFDLFEDVRFLLRISVYVSLLDEEPQFYALFNNGAVIELSYEEYNQAHWALCEYQSEAGDRGACIWGPKEINSLKDGDGNSAVLTLLDAEDVKAIRERDEARGYTSTFAYATPVRKVIAWLNARRYEGSDKIVVGTDTYEFPVVRRYYTKQKWWDGAALPQPQLLGAALVNGQQFPVKWNYEAEYWALAQ